MAFAVFNALEQAGGGGVVLAVQGQRSSISKVLVVVTQAKLRLDGGAVDAKLVEAVSCALCELHVLFAAVRIHGELDLEVHAGDNLCVRELPDMNVVAADDTRKSLDILSNILDANIFWRGLEKDARGSECKWDRSLENNEGDEERDGRISVKLARPVGEPNNQSSNYDADIAEGIADDVEHHGVHAHVCMVVSGGLGSLLGECVIVASMDARISTGSVFSSGGASLDDGGAIVSFGRFEKRRVLRRLGVISGGRFVIRVALLGDRRWVQAGGNNILSEAGGMNAQVVDTGEARMLALA